MHRTRKVLGFVVVLAMAASVFVLLAAAPASAAAGANAALLNPYCGIVPPPVGVTAPVCPSGDAQQLSSHDGLTAKLSGVAWGGDDAMSAYYGLFYYRQSPILGLTDPWHLVGVDSTPSVPDSAAPLSGTTAFGGGATNFPPAWPHFPTTDTKWKAFDVDFNTAGVSGPIDIVFVVCGEGTTSFDAIGGALASGAGFDRADNRRSSDGLLWPVWDCSNDGIPSTGGLGAPFATDGVGATVGFDAVFGVEVDNRLPVVNLPTFPTVGYHGDAIATGGWTMTAYTTPDAGDVNFAVCENVTPQVQTGGEWDLGHHGDDSSYWGGGCAVEGSMLGGPTTWTAVFSGSPTPGAFDLSGVLDENLRFEANVDPVPGGAVDNAFATIANSYLIAATPFAIVNRAHAVWDYDSAPGDRGCFSGSSAATSTIDPWRLTDADGDGREDLATAPAPDAGKLDIDDADNPVLKGCLKGPAGITYPMIQNQIAWEVLSGPGDIDADQPTYHDGMAVSCFDYNLLGIPINHPCSGGYAYWPAAFGHGGPIFGPFGGGYARPGSVADAPLRDPLGRGISRVCGLRACQKSDITDLALEAGIGSDAAAVNSVEAGMTTYRVCVDLNGNRACGDPGEISATATMTWTPAGRNHNHLWKTGTEAVNGHSGTATVAAPAGSTVSLTGIAHDGGHNALENTPVIWRLGNNSPGHFVSTQSTTGPGAAAVAVIGSSVLDAARTTVVTFCGDGDADGICDETPATVEVNWGGVVTSTSISSFSVNPTIGVFGTDFVISGTLLDGAAGAVSSATVEIQRRTLGSDQWVTIRNIITNGTGAFSTTDVDLAYNSDYRAVFPGNVSYTGATSDTDRAWVRVGIAKNVSDPTVFAGQAVRISGRVLPAHPGDVVTLQVLDNGRGWKNIASARLSSASTYAFSVVHHSSKSLLFRVTYPTQGILNAWNVSRNTRITWA